MREFETGATRDSDDTKIDYEGFLSPFVLERYGIYMTKHRKQADGKVRDSDNWQKGIPLDVYMKSMWRHFMSIWSKHRQGSSSDQVEEDLCAMLFNVQGYLHERLRYNACYIKPSKEIWPSGDKHSPVTSTSLAGDPKLFPYMG